jgi:hypothetical protein
MYIIVGLNLASPPSYGSVPKGLSGAPELAIKQLVDSIGAPCICLKKTTPNNEPPISRGDCLLERPFRLWDKPFQKLVKFTILRIAVVG